MRNPPGSDQDPVDEDSLTPNELLELAEELEDLEAENDSVQSRDSDNPEVPDVFYVRLRE